MSPAPATVPCQYRTGKTLGSGTYAVVKEAIHIKTGDYYACKVINKKLMEGREFMVRNEIAVLKRISSGHRNIVTLHDYFETTHNLYLCFDLCTGGELFDRICAKGNYYEGDAADLVRTIMATVKYIHDCGIVHRDLKPENLLFKTSAEDADIMIADFGLSRVMEEQKLNLLTEICGTPGYMAPEIFKKTGHSKPVDIWAMGVITYFLLAGYTPFDRDTPHQEMEAIISGNYKFEPEEYWANVSDTAKDFVRECLTIDPGSRPTAEEMLKHKWLDSDTPHFVPDPESLVGGPTDLLPHVKKAFNARRLWRKAALSIKAMNRMSALAGGPLGSNITAINENLRAMKEESEKERMEESSITHHHHLHQPDDSLNDDVPDNMRSAESKQERDALKGHDDIHVEERAKTGEVESKLASMHLKEKEKISGLPEET
ncbi:kinase-like domain-containing protein [Pterulicium gracile]|uniref:Kinase-like domain-containing protein n=1 Tax=Pterulicium gracile TaxID=1884261 RepID=A0A5C3QCQ0_9AGAR|nr:kinase-like domain-containing protein [Pterula gracilis]